MEYRLSELGGKIFKERHKLIETLKKHVTKIYDSLSAGKEKLNLSYKRQLI